MTCGCFVGHLFRSPIVEFVKNYRTNAFFDKIDDFPSRNDFYQYRFFLRCYFKCLETFRYDDDDFPVHFQVPNDHTILNLCRSQFPQ